MFLLVLQSRLAVCSQVKGIRLSKPLGICGLCFLALALAISHVQNKLESLRERIQSVSKYIGYKCCCPHTLELQLYLWLFSQV